ncbi:MAG: YihY/virulence factor BrkB family protein [Chitinophagaceae bacterium]
MDVRKQENRGNRILAFWRLMSNSFKEMKKTDSLRMAGATAFFTTFALPPILIILFQLFGLFLNQRFVGTEMKEILEETLGKTSASQINQTIKQFGTLARNWYITAGGFLFIVFVATTLFSVIKGSLNEIWNIGVKDKPGILFRLGLRARSLGIIVVAGLLFLAGIFLDGLELLSGNYLEKLWPLAGGYFKGALNEVVGVVIVTSWFIILFRYLADGRPSWRVAIAGGCLTGVLFSAGKTLIAFLIRNSNISTLYGASGSIVLILLFVFYSSFILYFGAGFIKVYSEKIHQPLRLVNKAFRYQLRELSESK